MVRTSLYQLVKTNSSIIINAGSLVATTGVNSVLGFAYWWLAARRFLPEAVGFASATISAMTLLGTLSVLGLGTLLIGELPRQAGKEGSLISTALILVGTVGASVGTVFALVAPFLSVDFIALRASVQSIVLFAAGVGLTAITLVLDQSLIGLLQGPLQFWRNLLFAMAKLVALFVVAIWLSHTNGLIIYATWASGNIFSLLALAIFVIVKGKGTARSYVPRWNLLTKLKLAALQHHMLNLLLQAPPLILPVLVTVMLSAKANAWFYIAWTISAFVSFIPLAFGTVLYATGSKQPDSLTHKVRTTLSLGAGACIVAYAVLLPVTPQILSLFGHIYAEQASWSLRILALGAFPLLLKNCYIAIHRIHSRVASALVPIVVAGLLEVAIPALGALLGSLTGLSVGLLVALCIEAAFMAPLVYKTVWPLNILHRREQCAS